MAEYIPRTAALEIREMEYQGRLRMLDYCGDTVAWNIFHEIKALPPADVAPVVHARWIEDRSGIIICPECKRGYNLNAKYTHYCPNCGAKMDMKDGGDNDAVD